MAVWESHHSGAGHGWVSFFDVERAQNDFFALVQVVFDALDQAVERVFGAVVGVDPEELVGNAKLSGQHGLERAEAVFENFFV